MNAIEGKGANGPAAPATTQTAPITIRLLAACAGDMKIEAFVAFANKELGPDTVRIAGLTPTPKVTAIGPADYATITELYILEFSEIAVKEKILSHNEDLKKNPAMHQGDTLMTSAVDVFQYLQMSTAGDCDVLVPTRFSLLRP